VVGKPNIKFFAAAPMLSKDGYPVGVFAIWGNEPRSVFTPFNRRELADLSRMAMRNLDHEVERLSDPDLRSTPLLDRDSIINGDYMPYHDSSLITPPLRLTSRFSGPQSDQNLTPPSSAQSNHQIFFNNQIGGYGKNHKDLMVDLTMSLSPAFQEMITPDSYQFTLQSSRPYSASDITSIHGQPPNTPSCSIISFPPPPSHESTCSLVPKDLESHELLSITADDFHRLSDDDVAEDPTFDPFVAAIPPTRVPATTTFNRSVAASPIGFPDLKADTATADTLAVNNSNASPLCDAPLPVLEIRGPKSISTAWPSPPKSNPTGSSGNFNRCLNQSEEIAHKMKDWAHKLKYQRLYVVQLEAKDPKMRDEKKLYASGALRKRIIAAYGVHEVPSLDSKIHFDAIRCRGITTYEDMQSKFQRGLLLAIHTQGGPLNQRNGGLVLAGYRRGFTNKPASIITADDHVNFKQAADAIAAILLDENGQLTGITQHNIDAARSIKYLANEAMGLGRNTSSSYESRTGLGRIDSRQQKTSGGSRQESTSTRNSNESDVSRSESRLQNTLSELSFASNSRRGLHRHASQVTLRDKENIRVLTHHNSLEALQDIREELKSLRMQMSSVIEHRNDSSQKQSNEIL
jgi:hypothetical protein